MIMSQYHQIPPFLYNYPSPYPAPDYDPYLPHV